MEILAHTRLVKYERNPEVGQALFASHARELEQLRRMKHTCARMASLAALMDPAWSLCTNSTAVAVTSFDSESNKILRTVAPVTMFTFDAHVRTRGCYSTIFRVSATAKTSDRVDAGSIVSSANSLLLC